MDGSPGFVSKTELVLGLYLLATHVGLSRGQITGHGNARHRS